MTSKSEAKRIAVQRGGKEAAATQAVLACLRAGNTATLVVPSDDDETRLRGRLKVAGATDSELRLLIVVVRP